MVSGMINGFLRKFFKKNCNPISEYQIVFNKKIFDENNPPTEEDDELINYYLAHNYKLVKSISLLRDIMMKDDDFILNRHIITDMFLSKKIKYISESLNIAEDKIYFILVPSNDDLDSFYAIPYQTEDGNIFSFDDFMMCGKQIFNENSEIVTYAMEDMIS